MSIYFPQAAVILRVTWEDFGSGDPVLKETSDIRVSARNVTVERNAYNEADTAKVTFEFKSFPFDPRCVRACGVSIFMENRKKVFNQDNSLALIEPNDLDINDVGSNKVFVGFADESNITFDDDARTITLDCRDYTGLFIDYKRINTEPVPLSSPIDEVIQGLINEQEATKQIQVVNRTGESPLPILSQMAPDFNPTTAVKNVKRNDTYWDIMMSILGRVGLIGFIELDKFIITKPQNVYEKKEIKQFIYGGNIKDLKFTRKLGRAKNFNVKVMSANLSTKEVLNAQIPKEATDPDFISRHGNTEVTVPQLDKDGKKIDPPKAADYVTFTVKDINDKDRLIKIGESIYDEMSRQQIEGSLTTFEMDIPEENSDKIITFNQIRCGTAIRIFMNPEEVGALKSDSGPDEKAKFLIRRGYPPHVAKAFSSSLARINTAFYTKAVTFELDQENGFSMKIEFINFIDIDSNMMG